MAEWNGRCGYAVERFRLLYRPNTAKLTAQLMAPAGLEADVKPWTMFTLDDYVASMKRSKKANG